MMLEEQNDNLPQADGDQNEIQHTEIQSEEVENNPEIVAEPTAAVEEEVEEATAESTESIATEVESVAETTTEEVHTAPEATTEHDAVI